jgi:lipoprotein signal peptidase
MPDQNGISALRWFAIAATVLLLDQLTKLWIMAEFALGDSRFISSFGWCACRGKRFSRPLPCH